MKYGLRPVDESVFSFKISRRSDNLKQQNKGKSGKNEFILLKKCGLSSTLNIEVFTNFNSEDIIADVLTCAQKIPSKTSTIMIESSLLALNGLQALAAWILTVRTNFRVKILVKDFIIGFPDFGDISIEEASIKDY